MLRNPAWCGRRKLSGVPHSEVGRQVYLLQALLEGPEDIAFSGKGPEDQLGSGFKFPCSSARVKISSAAMPPKAFWNGEIKDQS